MFVIEVDRALTPQGWVTPGRLLVEGERILAVGDRRLPIPEGIVHYGFAGTSAVPGFIDLHQHGGGGHDVMEATPEALEAIGTLHAAHGTTAWLPTTLTESPQCIAKALANVAKLRESDRAGMPEILGVH
ncbi:MAG: N-acetylglucosamine-6-phosphate deacetylase, partial [Firmicutes bacterium]|nr:N-acetylglucosamine-6-phosphate deacetylase [Bacillota bacterium]